MQVKSYHLLPSDCFQEAGLLMRAPTPTPLTQEAQTCQSLELEAAWPSDFQEGTKAAADITFQAR